MGTKYFVQYYSYLSKFDEIFTVNFTRCWTRNDKQQLKNKKNRRFLFLTRVSIAVDIRITGANARSEGKVIKSANRAKVDRFKFCFKLQNQKIYPYLGLFLIISEWRLHSTFSNYENQMRASVKFQCSLPDTEWLTDYCKVKTLLWVSWSDYYLHNFDLNFICQRGSGRYCGKKLNRKLTFCIFFILRAKSIIRN